MTFKVKLTGEAYEPPDYFSGLVEYPTGSKYRYKDNRLHSLEGPAVEHSDDRKEYWIEGKQYTEKEFNEKLREL